MAEEQETTAVTGRHRRLAELWSVTPEEAAKIDGESQAEKKALAERRAKAVAEMEPTAPAKKRPASPVKESGGKNEPAI